MPHLDVTVAGRTLTAIHHSTHLSSFADGATAAAWVLLDNDAYAQLEDRLEEHLTEQYGPRLPYAEGPFDVAGQRMHRCGGIGPRAGWLEQVTPELVDAFKQSR